MRTVWVSFDTIGRDCLEAAADVGAEIVGIVTLPGPIDPDRSGQCSFDELAARLDAALIETRDVNALETLNAIRKLLPELIFVVGWSQLVREPFIALAQEGVFGMHPTLLPRHRGRAPIPWAILCGLARTGVTLFEIVDSTADSGAIVGQVVVDIDAGRDGDDALRPARGGPRRARARVRAAARRPQRATRPAGPSRASAWPKRLPADGIIDWETRAPYLYDWVRAQTRPYPGAFTFLGDEKVVVWRARPVELEAPRRPGRWSRRCRTARSSRAGRAGSSSRRSRREPRRSPSGRSWDERSPMARVRGGNSCFPREPPSPRERGEPLGSPHPS